MGNSIQSVAMQNWRGGNGPLLGVDTRDFSNYKTVTEVDHPREYKQFQNDMELGDVIGIGLVAGILGIGLLTYNFFIDRGRI